MAVLTVKQVSDRTSVVEEVVRKWIRTGELKATMISRKTGWRIDEMDLDKFLKARTQRALDLVQHKRSDSAHSSK